MEKILSQILIVAYAGVGILGKIGYWPTFKDVYFYKKASANINTYGLWTLTSGITLVYALFILKNSLFITVAGLDLMSCFAIFIFTLNLKYRQNAIRHSFLSFLFQRVRIK